jgi:hypothetical protein
MVAGISDHKVVAMTVAEWAQFVALGIAGAFGLFGLFDGTRRMVARQTAGAGRIAALGVTIIGLLLGYSYWQYWTYSEAARWYRAPEEVRALPEDWGKKMAPARREATSKEIARRAFIDSGTLTSYFGASGPRKAYAPAPDDLKRREAVLTAGTRMEQKALRSFNEFILWLVLGLSAFVFGLCFAFESAPRPADAEAAADAPPVPPPG